MNIKKYFSYTTVFAFLFGFLFSAAVFAEQVSCDNLHFNIAGQQQVISGHSYQYGLDLDYQSLSGLENAEASINYTGSVDSFLQFVLKNSDYSFRIYKDEKRIDSFENEFFSYKFENNHEYAISAAIDFQECHYDLKKNISVFDTAYFYIGNFLETFNSDIDNTIGQNGVLLQTYFLSEESQKDKESFTNQMYQQLPYLQHTNDIFLAVDNYSLLFDVLEQFQSNQELAVNEKNIFLISNTNKIIIKKLLAKFIKENNISGIFVINTEEFEQILFNLSIGKAAYEDSFLVQNTLDLQAYKLSYTLTHLLDYLIFNGFPLDTLKLFLALSLAVLVIIFFKQFVGFSSFGVFYPLLFGFALHTVGLKTSVGFLLTAFLAVFIVNYLAKKITILISAKLGLTTILYILISLLSIALYKIFNIPQNEFLIFTNPMIMIAFIAILMTGKKLWNKVFPFKYLSWWENLARFGILSAMVYFILSSDKIHEYLLIHPWIVLLCLVLVFGLGRFSGLQVSEYFRFAPLIRKLRKKNS